MSNYQSCIFILTQLIGFEKSDNDEKITLPDQVEIDTLVQFKHFLQDSNIIESNLNDESSSYEMKMVENNDSFWSCSHCTYNNPIELNTCQICALPRKENHSLQVANDENRKLRLQTGKIIAHKNMRDETLQKVIWNCAIYGWVEELRLCVNVPRSSVEYLFYINCVLFELWKYCWEYFWFIFLFCITINKIVV